MSIDPTKPLPVAVNEAEKQQNNSKREPTPASWKPGQSGNPHGRPPKDWTFKDLIEEVAEEALLVKLNDGSISKQTYKKLLIKKLFQKAIEGDVQAAKELMNRRDGMPKQKVDVEAEGTWNITMKRGEE